MQDLNDLYYFAAVVDHGGFSPAGRALGIQKSKLSRRILLLEERLGVRLLNRSSRRFSATRGARSSSNSRCALRSPRALSESSAGGTGILSVA